MPRRHDSPSASREVAREAVAARGGEVVELRGDEALAVFASARQAIRAAADLQAALAEETAADPDLPIRAGIGLDAGEAIPVEGGFRGAALNLAARLCAKAGPGETLASDGVVHLARAVDGIRFEEAGAETFKGIDEPVRIVRVVGTRRCRRSTTGPDSGRAAARARRGGRAARRARPGALVAARQLAPRPARRGAAGRRLRPGRHRADPADHRARPERPR